ncbi:MAG: Rieske 2Fe-2S domain-containing protein [Granulosicoccus sp.]
MTVSTSEWCDLIDVQALDRNDVTPIVFNGQLLAVYDTVEGITVSDARCTHAGANLCDGYFDGRHIECPLHQGLFDAVTGQAKAAPAVRSIKMIESRVLHGTVQVRF